MCKPRQIDMGIRHLHLGAGRPVKHPGRNLQPTVRIGTAQAAAKNSVTRPLDRRVNADSKTKPRMPWVQQFSKLGSNTIRPHASIGYKPPAPEVFVPAFAAWPAALRRPAPPAAMAQRPTLNYHSPWPTQRGLIPIVARQEHRSPPRWLFTGPAASSAPLRPPPAQWAASTAKPEE